MKRVRQDGRLEPFSHLPGTCVVLPGSSFEVEVYPARLLCRDLLSGNVVSDWPLGVSGPVEGFTVQLDLERGCVRVWGIGSSGYFRYRVSADRAGNQVLFQTERGDVGLPEESGTFRYEMPKGERLSLGVHKSQDWEGVRRRGNLAEILPAWMRLGQTIEARDAVAHPNSLLEACAGQRQLAPFEQLFYAGFSGILAPRVCDENHLGLSREPMGQGADHPLPLLSRGAQIIRSLFVAEQGEELRLLPLLPVEFHAGRLIYASFSLGHFDMEWSKKRLRRLVLLPEKTGEVRLDLGSGIKQFRLRLSPRDRGHLRSCGDPVTLTKDQSLVLDRFQP